MDFELGFSTLTPLGPLDHPLAPLSFCAGCSDIINDSQGVNHGKVSSLTSGFRWAATWCKNDVAAPAAEESGLTQGAVQAWRSKQVGPPPCDDCCL